VKVSITIPVFNKSNFTKSCLQDLSNLKDHEVIVVDNNSSDNTEEIVKQFNVKYIKLDNNYGFGKAVNIGFKESSSDILMTLNNDIRVKSNYDNWTDKIIELSNNGFVGPTIGYLNNNFEFIKESNKLESYPYSYMSGWCLASSKANWDLIKENDQYFDERFFAYFEDTDLGFRIKNKNLNFILQEVPVMHFGKQTSKQLNTYKLYLESKKKFEDKWK
jgi:GT2 family glycosyltransferase